MLIETLFNPGDVVYVVAGGKVRRRKVWYLEVSCVGMTAEAKVTYGVSSRSPWACVRLPESEVFATESEARESMR